MASGKRSITSQSQSETSILIQHSRTMSTFRDGWMAPQLSTKLPGLTTT